MGKKSKTFSRRDDPRRASLMSYVVLLLWQYKTTPTVFVRLQTFR